MSVGVWSRRRIPRFDGKTWARKKSMPRASASRRIRSRSARPTPRRWQGSWTTNATSATFGLFGITDEATDPDDGAAPSAWDVLVEAGDVGDVVATVDVG